MVPESTVRKLLAKVRRLIDTYESKIKDLEAQLLIANAKAAMVPVYTPPPVIDPNTGVAPLIVPHTEPWPGYPQPYIGDIPGQYGTTTVTSDSLPGLERKTFLVDRQNPETGEIETHRMHLEDMA